MHRQPLASRIVALITSPPSRKSVSSSSGSQMATYPEIFAARSRFASLRRFRRWTYASRVRGSRTRLWGNRSAVNGLGIPNEDEPPRGERLGRDRGLAAGG